MNDANGGNTSTMDVDAGKRVIDVVPGLQLVCYSKGYVALRMKGKDWNGRRVTIGKPLYRDDLKALIETLWTECQQTKTYEETHTLDAIPF